MCTKKPRDYNSLQPSREVSVRIAANGEYAIIGTYQHCSCVKCKHIHKLSLIGLIKGESWEERIIAAKLKMQREADYLNKIEIESKEFESNFND